MDSTPISQAAKPTSSVPIVWSLVEVIEHTKLTRTQVYLAMKSGDLVAHRYGRRNLIYDNDLANFMNGLSTQRAA